MNLRLTWFKSVTLITLSAGLLLPTNVAEAAGSSSTKKASDHQEAVANPRTLLSKHVQEIGFFTFLSLIGCGVLAPEIFYKYKKNSQSLNKSENLNLQGEEINDPIEENTVTFEVISENSNKLNLISSLNKAEENELEDRSEQERRAA